jgi:hypothetical protein
VRCALALWLATTSVAAGQQVPTSLCEFDGFDVRSQLAEAKIATTSFYGCTAGKNCLPSTLKPGDPLVVNRTEGDWTCGYLVARKGSAQGWVRSGDIRLIAFDPNPPLDAWLGEWRQGKNHISMLPSKTAGKLALEGEAYWIGTNHNEHSGEISGEASPVGNQLRYSEGEGEGCKVDFALWGKYLLANDNNMCGGLNVRFWGVWKHEPRK